MNNSNPGGNPTHWPSLFQLGLSGVAVLLLWGAALFVFAEGLFQFAEGVSVQRADPSAFLMGAGLAWIGMLLLPSAWFALMRLMNRPVSFPHWLTWRNLGTVIWWMVPVVVAGYGVAVTPSLAWLLLPPLNILALTIPVMWYLSLGGRGLRSSTPQNIWGVLGAGLVVGPGVILVIEIVGAILGVVGLVLWLSPVPGFMEEVQRLLNIFQNSSNLDPSLVMEFAETYLMRPSVLVGGLLFAAVFAPLLEEFLKPIGLWFMNKQTLTPGRGFIAGMLSGAAFGLFESLLQGVSGAEWVILAVARAGTSLIHIFNSGLVGWGFALAWQKRSPGPWLTRYLIAVGIHGLWNGMTVMITVASLPEQTLVNPVWGVVGASMLAILAVGCFISLIVLNRRLQTEERQSSPTYAETEAEQLTEPTQESNHPPENP